MTFDSSNEASAVATVTADAVSAAREAGEAVTVNVTCTATDSHDNAVSDDLALSIPVPTLKTVTVTADKESVGLGEVVTCKATWTPPDPSFNLTWFVAPAGMVQYDSAETSDTLTVTVKDDAIATDPVTVTCQVEDSTGHSDVGKATFAIVVDTPAVKPVTAVTVTGDSELLIGTTGKVTAVVTPADATGYTVAFKGYAVNGSGVCDVAEDGTLTAKARGSIHVRATVTNQDGSTVQSDMFNVAVHSAEDEVLLHDT